MPIYQGIDDPYLPVTPKPLLQQYDSYQIYSLLWFEYTYLLSAREVPIRVPSNYYYTNNYEDNYGYGQEIPTYLAISLMNFGSSPSYSYIEPKQSKWLMYQKYSVIKIPFNFSDIAAKIKITPRNSYTWVTIDSINVIDSVIDEYLIDNVNLGSHPPIIDRSSYQLAADFANSASNPNYNPNKFTYVLKQEIYYLSSRRHIISYQLVEDTYTRQYAPVSCPNLFTLIEGFIHDTRTKPPNYPTITPTKSGTLSIGYYRQNRLEQLPEITSLDWMTYQLDIVKGEVISLPLIEPVFGTLYFSGDNTIINDVITQLASLVLPTNSYKWQDYYYSNVNNLVTE